MLSKKPELLSPAGDMERLEMALHYGADAVYLAGTQFGLRAAAGNFSDEELYKAVSMAHAAGAKVHVTCNTLPREDELSRLPRFLELVQDAGADALIIADLGVFDMAKKYAPLVARHVSTQLGVINSATAKVLYEMGAQRVVLARETPLADIRRIRAAVPDGLELEAFVHGAMCVSFSGRCLLSNYLTGRDGNRGECAQPCRAPWNLVDATGRVLVREQHLLSIRDLDLSDHLEALADAGVVSFKIEGRLKDADYVKNVVSHLRRKLDALLARRPELGRASLGTVRQGFEPDPRKTFNRGLSTYRLEGSRQVMGTPEAAHHLGEAVGTVRSVQADRVVLEAPAPLNPGDGLAFVNGTEVCGTVVNAVEGAQVFVQEPRGLKPGTRLHRNLDHRWIKALRAAKVERRIPVAATLTLTDDAATLRLEDPAGLAAEARAEGRFEAPRDAEVARTAIQEALARLGNTPFELATLALPEVRFVPLKVLNGLRREAAEALEALRRSPRLREGRRPPAPELGPLPQADFDFTWNVANAAARSFYERAGAQVLEPAAELQPSLQDRVVMTTRHCVAFELGWCALHPNPEPWRRLARPEGPLYLENGPTRLECRFDCARCRMELVLRKAAP